MKRNEESAPNNDEIKSYPTKNKTKVLIDKFE